MLIFSCLLIYIQTFKNSLTIINNSIIDAFSEHWAANKKQQLHCFEKLSTFFRIY